MSFGIDLTAVEEPRDPDFIIQTGPYPPPLFDEVDLQDSPSSAADAPQWPERRYLTGEDLEKPDFPITARKNKFDPAEAMYKARRYVAKWVFSLLASVIVGGTALLVAATVAHQDIQQAKDLFITVFTAILALASSTVGFYYGAKGHDKDT